MEKVKRTSFRKRTSLSGRRRLTALKAKFKRLLFDVHDTSSSSSSSSNAGEKISHNPKLKRKKSTSSDSSACRSPSEAQKSGMSSEISSEDEVKAKSKSPKTSLQFLLQQNNVEVTSLSLQGETPRSASPPLGLDPRRSFSTHKDCWGRFWEGSSEPTSPADLSHNFNLNYRGGVSSPISLLHSLSQREPGRHASQRSEIFFASPTSSDVDHEPQDGTLGDGTSTPLSSSQIKTLPSVHCDEDQGECYRAYPNPNPSSQEQREHQKHCVDIMNVQQRLGVDSTLDGAGVLCETGSVEGDVLGGVEYRMTSDCVLSENLSSNAEPPTAKFYNDANQKSNSNDHPNLKGSCISDNDSETGHQARQFVVDSKQEIEDDDLYLTDHLDCANEIRHTPAFGGSLEEMKSDIKRGAAGEELGKEGEEMEPRTAHEKETFVGITEENGQRVHAALHSNSGQRATDLDDEVKVHNAGKIENETSDSQSKKAEEKNSSDVQNIKVGQQSSIDTQTNEVRDENMLHDGFTKSEIAEAESGFVSKQDENPEEMLPSLNYAHHGKAETEEVESSAVTLMSGEVVVEDEEMELGIHDLQTKKADVEKMRSSSTDGLDSEVGIEEGKENERSDMSSSSLKEEVEQIHFYSHDAFQEKVECKGTAQSLASADPEDENDLLNERLTVAKDDIDCRSATPDEQVMEVVKDEPSQTVTPQIEDARAESSNGSRCWKTTGMLFDPEVLTETLDEIGAPHYSDNDRAPADGGEGTSTSPSPNLDVYLTIGEEEDLEPPEHNSHDVVTCKTSLHVKLPFPPKSSSEMSTSETSNSEERRKIVDDTTVTSQHERGEPSVAKFSSVQRYWADVSRSEYMLIEGKRSPSFKNSDDKEYSSLKNIEGRLPSPFSQGKYELGDIERSSPLLSSIFHRSSEGDVDEREMASGKHVHQGASSSSANVEYDFEQVVRQQTTHDLVCPVCGTCVTERIILKKRKRTRSFDENATPPRTTQMKPGLGDQEGNPKSRHPVDDSEDEVWGCLTCLSFFMFTDRGVGRWNGALESESRTELQPAMFQEKWERTPCVPLFGLFRGKSTLVDPEIRKSLLEESSREENLAKTEDPSPAGPLNPVAKEFLREEDFVVTEEATTTSRADIHPVPLYEDEEQVSCFSYLKTIRQPSDPGQAHHNSVRGVSVTVESQEFLLPNFSLDRTGQSKTGQPVVEVVGDPTTLQNQAGALFGDPVDEIQTTRLISRDLTARALEQLPTSDNLNEKASPTCLPLLLPTFSWSPLPTGDQEARSYVQDAVERPSKQATQTRFQQEELLKDMSEKAPIVLETSIKDAEEDLPTAPSPSQRIISEQSDRLQGEPVQQILKSSVDKASMVCFPLLLPSFSWGPSGSKGYLDVESPERIEEYPEPSSQPDVSKVVRENTRQIAEVVTEDEQFASLRSKSSSNPSSSAQHVSGNGVQLLPNYRVETTPSMSELQEIIVEHVDGAAKEPLKELPEDTEQTALSPRLHISKDPVEEVSVAGLPLLPTFAWEVSTRPTDSDVQTSSWKIGEARGVAASTAPQTAGIVCFRDSRKDATVEIVNTSQEDHETALLVNTEEIVPQSSSTEPSGRGGSELEVPHTSDGRNCPVRLVNVDVGTKISAAGQRLTERPVRKVRKEEDCICLPPLLPKFSWGHSGVLDQNPGVEVEEGKEEFIGKIVSMPPVEEEVSTIGFRDQMGSALMPGNLTTELSGETQVNDISLPLSSQADAAHVVVHQEYINSGSTTSQTPPWIPVGECRESASCNCVSELLPAFSWGALPIDGFMFNNDQGETPAESTMVQQSTKLGEKLTSNDGNIRSTIDALVVDENGDGIVRPHSSAGAASQDSSSLEEIQEGKESNVSGRSEAQYALLGSSKTEKRASSSQPVPANDHLTTSNYEAAAGLSEKNAPVAENCSPTATPSPSSSAYRKIVTNESYIEGHLTTTRRTITMTKLDEEPNEEIGSIQVDHYVSHFEADIERGHLIQARKEEILQEVHSQSVKGDCLEANFCEDPTTKIQAHVGTGMTALAEQSTLLLDIPEEDIQSEIKPLHSPLVQPETLEALKGEHAREMKDTGKSQDVSCSCLPLPVPSAGWLWPSWNSLAEGDGVREHLLGKSEEKKSRNCLSGFPSSSFYYLLRDHELPGSSHRVLPPDNAVADVRKPIKFRKGFSNETNEQYMKQGTTIYSSTKTEDFHADQAITIYSPTTGSLPGPDSEIGQEINSVLENRLEGDPQSTEGKFHEVLKSVVYGGLDVTFVSLGVVSSAAGADAKTITVLAMGLANVIFGLFTFFQTVMSLYYNQREVFQQQVGQSIQLNGALAHLSFLFFGVLAPITYALSFRHSVDVNYKFASTCAVSLISIILLGAARAFVASKSAIRIILALLVTGFLAAISGYGVGHIVSVLLEEWGFD